MKKILLLLSLFYCSSILLAADLADHSYKYRLTLKDKGETTYSIESPEKFLSPKAIERRLQHNIKIDSSDLPISKEYLDQIEATGSIIVAKSKWNNTVAVHCADSLMIDQLKQLPFIKDVTLVWKNRPKKKVANEESKYFNIIEPPVDSLFYGYANDNIRLLNGDSLHAKGFMGKDMTIGVIDAGFNNLPNIEYFDNINILGFKDFVFESSSLFEQANQHGTNVLSCIATNKPYRYVGTAPHASFWILGTEDSDSEYPIEEDYWASAIEYADSVGVDVINTSLGYTKFDAPATSFTREMLDGESSLIARAANNAVKKGMFLVISAGNAGNKEWGKISTPADAKDVLTVGAIARDSTIANFSSKGLTADLRVKPDVVALGRGSVVISEDGRAAYKNGTSFSSPIMCGIVTCLWQAFPSLTNVELLEVIRQSADRYEDPSIQYGYGIPDMHKAMGIAQKLVERKTKQ